MNSNNWFSLINFSLLNLYFSLLWLVYFCRWLFGKNFGNIFKVSIISYVIIVVSTFSLNSYLIYQQWSNSPLLKYLLPPVSSYYYQIIFESFIYYVISILSGIALFYLIKLIIKLAKVDFINRQEVKLLALGAIMVGWYNIVVYLCLLVVLMLFSSIFINLFKQGRGTSIPLTPYVFLSLIIVLLIGYKLSYFFGLY